MTNRYNALIVVLENDVLDDDAQSIINAVMHIRGILTVEPHISDANSAVALHRTKADMIHNLLKVIEESKAIEPTYPFGKRE